MIGEPFPNVIEENGRIFIVDITGERWDVTHAKQRYGMEPAKPQIGVGRTGVVPIMNPLMLSESDEAYPDDEDEFLILGSNLNGDTKAYPISRLAVNEVANDIMIVEQDIHVAFAY